MPTLNLTPGGGDGLSDEGVAAIMADEASATFATAASTFLRRPGEPGDVGQVLKHIGSDRPGWGAEQTLFRGEWAADALAKVYDFTSLPPEFSTSVQGVGVPAFLSGGSAPYVTTAEIQAGNIDSVPMNSSTLSLDLSQSGVSSVSRVVSYWSKNHTGGNGTNAQYYKEEFSKNGVVLAQKTSTYNFAWEAVQTACGSQDVISWTQRGSVDFNSAPTARLLVGRVEVYKQDAPFMLNEHVTRSGKLYRSLIDNNADTPGESVNWKEVLDLPVKSGITANRPSPTTAGAGYQFFDTSLNRPVWVDATATGWVDSAGTTV